MRREDRTRERDDATTGLARAEHEGQDFVVGEGADSEAAHPFAWSIVGWDVRKGLLLLLVRHEPTVESKPHTRPEVLKSVDNRALWKTPMRCEMVKEPATSRSNEATKESP